MSVSLPTLATALEHILPTWTLKMNPFSAMRDPRESHALLFESPVEPTTDLDDETDDQVFRRGIQRFAELFRMGRELNGRVKVLSFTVDDPGSREQATAIFGRGFAHRRLWEQYADSHRGVCICFDRTTLIRVVKDAVRKIDEVAYGEVTYADGEIAPEAVRIPLKQLLERPVEETFDRHVRAHLHDLFFTKLRDWESECEFRFVIDLPYGAIARRKGYLPPEPEPPPPELVPA